MAEFTREAHEFGFSHIELNSILATEQLEELVGIEGLRISSIHAPCPNYLSSQGLQANSLSLSSFDEDERKEAVESVKATIELAYRVGAKVVVIHAGRIKLESALPDQLLRLYDQGQAGNDEYDEIMRRLVAVRMLFACAHIDATKESLRDLVWLAAEREVMLCMENRLHYMEIPSIPEEAETIMEEFPSELLGYWHDVGHAEVQSRLGFTPHQDWFPRLSERMIGIHLHDVRGIRDHYVPGIGDMDWEFISDNIPPNALRVCEIGEWNNPGDVRQAVSFLRSKGIV